MVGGMCKVMNVSNPTAVVLSCIEVVVGVLTMYCCHEVGCIHMVLYYHEMSCIVIITKIRKYERLPSTSTSR